jgi:hypothetical protein
MTRSKKLDQLVSSVEDLLAQLPDGLTPEVAALRDKVDAGIFEAWTSVAGEDRDTRGQMARSAIRPWTTAGLALLACTAGLIAYRIGRSSPRL